MNVRSYTAKELLDRVRSLGSFNGIPKGYWNIWVRSQEDAFNQFDDKVYLFKGEEFVFVAPCTTHTGATGLKNYESYGATGAAVLKSDLIVYDSHYRGMHKGKVLAYRQGKVWPYYRDSNKDNKVDESGALHNDKVIYANIHPATYLEGDKTIKKLINGWSLACLVYASRKDFDRFMTLTVDQPTITNCILKEF